MDLAAGRIFGVSGAAISRSLRIVLPRSVCSASMTPSTRAVIRQPVKVGSSQDQDIQGIAVLHPGARDETEVEWEGRADGQELVEPEEPLPFVVLELAPASRRG